MGEAKRRFAVVRFEDNALDRLGEADEKFFARHPHRQHRIRLAGRAEVKAVRKGYGPKSVRIDPGEALFAVVRYAFKGGMLKAFTVNDARADTDVAEDLAAALYRRLTRGGPEMAIMEATMRRIAAEEDRL